MQPQEWKKIYDKQLEETGYVYIPLLGCPIALVVGLNIGLQVCGRSAPYELAFGI